MIETLHFFPASFRWVLLALALAVSPGFSQSADLANLAPGAIFRDCPDCPEMVVVPSGSFVRGDFAQETLSMPRAADEAGETPTERAQVDAARNAITLPRAFGVGRYEITRAEFARFIEESGYVADKGCFAWNGSGYSTDAAKSWDNPGFEQTDRDPAVCVNWNDAKAYTHWLTEKTGKAYRLLNGSEWEYAARASGKPPRPWGEDTGTACRYANVADAASKRGVPGTAASWTFHDCDDGWAYTAPVGGFPPNAFGLYDMLGNVWEWTEDCATASLPQTQECSQRVLRGGSWVDSPDLVRYDFRFDISPLDRDYYAGFRVARPE